MTARPPARVLAMVTCPHTVAQIAAALAPTGLELMIVRDGAEMTAAIGRWPILILVDLTTTGWQVPIRRAKNLPHTHAIPVIAFGDGPGTDGVRAARELGCDQVWPRTALGARLPELLRAILHPPVRELDGWDEPPPALLCRGIKQFNAGEYWECHETLEGLWRAEARPIREVYQGILQIGIAFFHLKNRHYGGALKMFRRGLPRLSGLPEVVQGVRVEKLANEARAVHDQIASLGAEAIADLAFTELPQITGLPCI